MPKKMQRAEFTQTNLIDSIRDFGYGYEKLGKDHLKIVGSNGFLDCVIDRKADQVTILFNSYLQPGCGQSFSSKVELFRVAQALLLEKYETRFTINIKT